MNGNQLKIVALVTMTIDHIGVLMFPHVTWLRIVGRLSFPIFAYMIAEGCFYTHRRRRYVAGLAIVGCLCQVVYALFMGSLEQSIMTTLALGALTVFAMQDLARRRDAAGVLMFLGMLAADVLACCVLPVLLARWDFSVDYGLFGVLLVAFAYAPRLFIGPQEPGRLRACMLATTAAGLVLVALDSTWVQWFGLAAVALLACYDGTRGTLSMKYVFYVYYPLHLAVLYGISLLV